MSTNFYVPSLGTESWRQLLADSEKHWKDKRSAKCLAEAWENAKGFPKSWINGFKSENLDLEIVLGLPEHKVKLDNYGRASQNDLFILARDKNELFSIAVEGKVDEDFGPILKDWYLEPSDGKVNRLKEILELLGLDPSPNSHFDQRYQLYHRTASAILMAKKLHAIKAMIVVHSFSETPKNHKEDFDRFVALFDSQIKIGVGEIKKVQSLSVPDYGSIELFFGWIHDQPSDPNKSSANVDKFDSDLESKFWTAAGNAKIERNSYIISYPYFIDYFKKLTVIDEANLTIGIHFVYGWMPTIFNFGSGDLITQVLEILNNAKAGQMPSVPEFEILKKFLNNSLVGTSKLLHFINPHVFAIWDSKICKFVTGKTPHEYRVGKIANYQEYLRFLKDLIVDSRFQNISDKINLELGYSTPASPFRVAELIMFTGKKNLNPI